MQREEFTKLIEDDEESEAQEAWLEESQEFPMNLETDINIYLDRKEEWHWELSQSNTHSELSVVITWAIVNSMSSSMKILQIIW